MRVSYRRRHPGPDGQIPGFLKSEFDTGTWERTGFDVDFPAMSKNPAVAAAVGYVGRNFVAESIDITRWYNKATKAITGSVVFSHDCEGPPGIVHGGAVASALDDILGTMVWREAGFSRAGIPTMQLTVFAEVALRDPTSGALLAEGEGLFYLKKPPVAPGPSSSTTSSSTLPRGSSPVGTSDLSSQRPTGVRATQELRDTGRNRGGERGSSFPDHFSYDEAIRFFGVGNPNAAANLIEFYDGDASVLQRAKL